MKKILLLVIPLFLFSCEKNDILLDLYSDNYKTDLNEDPSSIFTDEIDTQYATPPGSTRMRTFYFLPAHWSYNEIFGLIWIPDRAFCMWPAGNCLPTVVVHTDRSDEASNLAVVFKQHLNNNEISDFFTNHNYSALFPEVDLLPNVINQIQTQEIKLHHFYNEDDSTDYYVGLPANTIFNATSDTAWISNVHCALRIKTCN